MKHILILLFLCSVVSFSQDFWQPANGPCSGTISSVVFNKQNGTVYVGSDMGLWRSTNVGVNWTQITTGLTNTMVNTIAIAPNGNIIVATSGYPNGGIFISTDNGTSWTKKNGNLTNPETYFCVVNSKGDIFIAMVAGVYRSTNNGTNWTLVNSRMFAQSLVIKSNDDIYLGNSNDGVFRSTDNGDTWKQINNGLANITVNTFIFNSKNDLFAGTAGSGIFRLTGTDTTWSEVNTGLSTNLTVYDLAINSGDTLYAGTRKGWVYRSSDNGANWSQVISSANANATSLDTYKSQVITNSSGGVYASMDNGINWARINPALRELSVGILASRFGDVYAGFLHRSSDNGETWKSIGPSSTTSPRGLVLTSTGTIILGTDFGINITTDGGTTWTTNANLSAITTMAIKSNNNIFAGTKKLGVYRSTDLGVTWAPKNSVSMANKQINTIAYNSKGDIFTAASDSIYRSTDNGDSWIGIKVAQNQPANTIAIGDSDYIFAGTVNGVYSSTDNGQNWLLKRNGMPSLYNISRIAINSSGVVFAGGLFGVGMYKSTNNGEAWTRITKGLADSSIGAITVTSNGYVFIATEKGVYRSRSITTSVKENKQTGIPKEISLLQNYPNPFNPTTNIEFQIPQNGFVTLKVYDALGREATTLANEQMNAGSYKTSFDGNGLSSGIYFYRLHVGNYVAIKKMMLIK